MMELQLLRSRARALLWQSKLIEDDWVPEMQHGDKDFELSKILAEVEDLKDQYLRSGGDLRTWPAPYPASLNREKYLKAISSESSIATDPIPGPAERNDSSPSEPS